MTTVIDTVSPFKDGIQYAFDATTLGIAETCLRKYKFTIIDRWRPKYKSVHLLFGGHFATALEHYYKHIAEGMESNEALIEVVWEALRNTWEYKLDAEGNKVLNANGDPIGAPWMPADANKTREALIRSIVWYVDQFEDDPIKVVTLANGKPAVEYSFKLPVDDGIVLCGHIDRLVDYAGDYYCMDQKTTSSTITERFFEQFKPNMQMSLYSFAGKAIYNLPVKGVIIDGAQIAVGFTRFQRGFTFRSSADLDEWYQDTMALIGTIQKAARENIFPGNSASCGNYGGCEFRKVCQQSPDVRGNFLRGDYVQEEQWNPLIER